MTTRYEKMVERATRYVREDWSFMLDRPIELLDSWAEGEHMLFVYRPAPHRFQHWIVGIDCTAESPIGTPDPTDEELAIEIARFDILEPGGPQSEDAADNDEIQWWGHIGSPVWHPRTLTELAQRSNIM